MRKYFSHLENKTLIIKRCVQWYTVSLNIDRDATVYVQWIPVDKNRISSVGFQPGLQSYVLTRRSYQGSG